MLLKNVKPGESFNILGIELTKTDKVGVNYTIICIDSDGNEHAIYENADVVIPIMEKIKYDIVKTQLTYYGQLFLLNRILQDQIDELDYQMHDTKLNMPIDSIYTSSNPKQKDNKILEACGDQFEITKKILKNNELISAIKKDLKLNELDKEEFQLIWWIYIDQKSFRIISEKHPEIYSNKNQVFDYHNKIIYKILENQ